MSVIHHTVSMHNVLFKTFPIRRALTFTKRVMYKKDIDVSNSCNIFSNSSGRNEVIRLKTMLGVTQNARPFRVSVEGNISSGKSTFLQHFKQKQLVDIYAEPINKWRNVQENNLLNLLYTDITRWNFLFQHYVQLARFTLQTTLPSTPGITVQMYERSLQNNRFCFVEMAYLHGYLTNVEYTVMNKWFDQLIKLHDISIDLIVYIRSKPETCLQRIVSRGRPEEAAVSLEYLQQLNDMHENWLMSPSGNPGAPILVLDGERSIEALHKIYIQNYDYIFGCKSFHGKRLLVQ